VQDIEREPSFNIQHERERARRKQKECVLKQCKMQMELKQIIKEVQSKVVNGEMWKVIDNYLRGVAYSHMPFYQKFK
jgi:hypothetical protein